MSQTNFTLLDYSNWLSNKVPPLHDVKTCVPLPLLSYTINKVFPADELGYQGSLDRALKEEISPDNKSWTRIITGSSGEGLKVSHYEETVSDIDVMCIPKEDYISDILVSVYEEGIVTGHSARQFQKAYPGYVVLTAKEDFQPFLTPLKDIPIWDNYVTISTFTKLDSGSINKKKVSLDHFGNKNVVIKLDFVYAYPCNGWPIQAKTWPDRYRPAKWPSSDQIKGILEKGTHFVQKAPRGVSEKDSIYYWRISFSIAEMDLCLSFNDTQRQCAILMKILKQKELVARDLITSYHMKTIMFWACEEMPETNWKTEFVSNCFMYLLDKLYLAVVKRHLPHYFIPELNLFENIPSETLMSMARVILKIRNNPLPFIGSFTKSYVILYMHQSMKIEGVTVVTDAFLKDQIVEDSKFTSSNLMKLFTIMLFIAKKKYERYGRSHIFNEYIKCLEKTADIVGSAIQYRKLCLNLVEVAVLAVFDEVTITPYFHYIKGQKLLQNVAVGQNNLLLDKRRFFKHLQLAHKANSAFLAHVKASYQHIRQDQDDPTHHIYIQNCVGKTLFY